MIRILLALFSVSLADISLTGKPVPLKEASELARVLNMARDLQSSELEIELAKAYNAKQKAKQQYDQAKYVMTRLEDNIDDTMYNMACKEEVIKRKAYRKQVKRYSALLNALRVTQTAEQLRRKAELLALQQATRRNLANAQMEWKDSDKKLRKAQYQRYLADQKLSKAKSDFTLAQQAVDGKLDVIRIESLLQTWRSVLATEQIKDALANNTSDNEDPFDLDDKELGWQQGKPIRPVNLTKEMAQVQHQCYLDVGMAKSQNMTVNTTQLTLLQAQLVGEIIMTQNDYDMRLLNCDKLGPSENRNKCILNLQKRINGTVVYAKQSAYSTNNQMCQYWPKKSAACQRVCFIFNEYFPEPTDVETCSDLPVEWQEECFMRVGLFQSTVGGNDSLFGDDGLIGEETLLSLSNKK